jgi:hypothetical protein
MGHFRPLMLFLILGSQPYQFNFPLDGRFRRLILADKRTLCSTPDGLF